MTIVVIAFLIFLSPRSSYAIDNKAENTILAKTLLEYDLRKKLIPEKKAWFLVGKQFVLDEEKKQRNTMVQREMPNLPFKAQADIYKIHQPLVSRNSGVPFYEKILIPYKSSTIDLEFSSVLSGVKQGGVIQVGAAFLTTLAVHEFGHVVVADYVGASGIRLNFFKKHGGNFFLGSTIVEQIDNKSRLPLSMGGAMASDLTFEHALQSYRKNPNLYNKSLLFFSAVDFLWYSAYTFYLSNTHPYFDPVAISKESRISKDIIFSIALAKTMMNAYRVYSGQDTVVPYFTVDKSSAILSISVIF